jgi:hypothetical protein
MNVPLALPALCTTLALSVLVTPSLAVAQAEPPAPATQAAPAPAPVETAPVAAADPAESGERGSLSGTFSVLGGIGYSYTFAAAFGVGVRGQFAIVPKGFLHSLKAPMHDELTLEPGLDYFRVGYGNAAVETLYSEFTPLVGVAWNFWITDNFVVYPKVDIGLRIGTYTTSYYDTVTNTHVNISAYFQGAAGAAYRFGPVALRAEVGWQAFRAGVGVDLF